MPRFCCPGCHRDTFKSESALKDHQDRRRCYPELRAPRVQHAPTRLEDYFVTSPAIKRGQPASADGDVEVAVADDVDTDDDDHSVASVGSLDSTYDDLPSDVDDEDDDAQPEKDTDEEGAEGDAAAINGAPQQCASPQVPAAQASASTGQSDVVSAFSHTIYR